MQKTTISQTLSQRKRKQPPLFSPLSHKEEQDITRALQLSLRKIPLDDAVSEDESEHEEVDEKEEEADDFEDDVQNEPEQYETKWSKRRQEVQVEDFDQPTGPIKTLPSTQGVKNFFELMFTKKVWHHICKQTNIYAKQRMLLNPELKWETLTVGAQSLGWMPPCNGFESKK